MYWKIEKKKFILNQLAKSPNLRHEKERSSRQKYSMKANRRNWYIILDRYDFFSLYLIWTIFLVFWFWKEMRFFMSSSSAHWGCEMWRKWSSCTVPSAFVNYDLFVFSSTSFLVDKILRKENSIGAAAEKWNNSNTKRKNERCNNKKNNGRIVSLHNKRNKTKHIKKQQNRNAVRLIQSRNVNGLPMWRKAFKLLVPPTIYYRQRERKT